MSNSNNISTSYTIELVYEGWDNSEIIEEINKIMKDRKKEILDIRLATKSKKEAKVSAIKSVKIFYKELKEERIAPVYFEQIANYHKFKSEEERLTLIRSWIKEHHCKTSITSIKYEQPDGIYLDLFAFGHN